MHTDGIIYIYNDRGVNKKCFAELKASILTIRPELKKRVKKINANDIIAGNWMQHAILLCFPGGGDVGYVNKLNGAGNANIRHFLHDLGGTYLGICAGAYFGSNFCDFHRGDTRRGYETIAPRELAFYPGTALGPTLAPFVANSDIGARTAHLKWIADGEEKIFESYHNGGCSFPEAFETPKTTVLATYNNQDPPSCTGQPAIIQCVVGKGKAVLSGPHPEFRRPDGTVTDLFKALFDRALPLTGDCTVNGDINVSAGKRLKRRVSGVMEQQEPKRRPETLDLTCSA